ncbi:tryptophan 2-C-methyltransferase [Amycolatopsis acidicola]|uniref:Tryptophan 2-C-methyltransferase n=1 Tax=Amycolatopsis acidicola TaxID=2596893 RepID=A0A5N0VHL1_9PSEU|nr:tryptophan 2-C-methyltransferase [Amycolatopsis acidicola]KAA9164924.1 tryptophan 2-C-methyltransferase [Amycolatopsis acidicola]
MGKSLITLVNPNLVHPPITPYALDILTTSLESAGFDVEVVDLTFRRDDWWQVLREYFSGRDPMLVGVTVRNTDTIYAQQQRVFLEDHRKIIDEIKANTPAPIVGGGVGFSSMPFALVDFFDIPFGVKGPGENILVRLAESLYAGESPEHVPGLLLNRGGGRVDRVPLVTGPRRGKAAFTPLNTVTSYTRRSGHALKVDNLRYYRGGGLGNILTKNGCAYSCAHCVEPDAKGGHFTRRAVAAVVDEMETLCAQGVYDLHTTDSEFNLAVAHSKNVLREVIRRRESDPDTPLRQLRLWIYAQPTPFDDELLELLVQAGCAGINLAPDHVREEMLDDWKVTGRGRRYYDFSDVRRLVSRTKDYGLPVMVEVLLGMPGETLETMRDAVEQTLALDVTVAGYSLGIRAFPYSPLGIQLAEQCAGVRTLPGLQSDSAKEPIVLKPRAQCASVIEYERQFVFDDAGEFRPVYFLSPELPEDPSTFARPNGRWERSVELLWEMVPDSELHRVMLPTLPGITEDDNNYADNPFLLRLIQLGYTGAFWSHWPRRREIMRGAA